MIEAKTIHWLHAYIRVGAGTLCTLKNRQNVLVFNSICMVQITTPVHIKQLHVSEWNHVQLYLINWM